ncbi:hypothetical protein T492DRAFT_295066 [Pavlovales sp. CCMP2436]|nr:hypothetical protein T492DRAFT_295066 [Pavlovales sp. CCMP2436]
MLTTFSNFELRQHINPVKGRAAWRSAGAAALLPPTASEDTSDLRRHSDLSSLRRATEPAAAQPVPSHVCACRRLSAPSHRLLHHQDQLRHEVVRAAGLDLLPLLGASLLEVGDRPPVVARVAEPPDVVQVAGEHAHGRCRLAINRDHLATTRLREPACHVSRLAHARPRAPTCEGVPLRHIFGYVRPPCASNVSWPPRSRIATPD